MMRHSIIGMMLGYKSSVIELDGDPRANTMNIQFKLRFNRIQIAYNKYLNSNYLLDNYRYNHNEHIQGITNILFPEANRIIL